MVSLICFKIHYLYLFIFFFWFTTRLMFFLKRISNCNTLFVFPSINPCIFTNMVSDTMWNQIPLLCVLINCISAKLVPKMLFWRDKYTLHFSNFLIIDLCNPFSNYWFDITALLKTPFRSSHPDVFLEKSVLKISDKFTGEHPSRSAISIKLLCNFIEIPVRHGYSPVNVLHIFRTPFLKNTSGWLLLPIRSSRHFIKRSGNHWRKTMLISIIFWIPSNIKCFITQYFIRSYLDLSEAILLQGKSFKSPEAISCWEQAMSCSW